VYVAIDTLRLIRCPVHDSGHPPRRLKLEEPLSDRIGMLAFILKRILNVVSANGMVTVITRGPVVLGFMYSQNGGSL
jgi:hypothetical protein